MTKTRRPILKTKENEHNSAYIFHAQPHPTQPNSHSHTATWQSMIALLRVAVAVAAAAVLLCVLRGRQQGAHLRHKRSMPADLPCTPPEAIPVTWKLTHRPIGGRLILQLQTGVSIQSPKYKLA